MKANFEYFFPVTQVVLPLNMIALKKRSVCLLPSVHAPRCYIKHVVYLFLSP